MEGGEHTKYLRYLILAIACLCSPYVVAQAEFGLTTKATALFRMEDGAVLSSLEENVWLEISSWGEKYDVVSIPGGLTGYVPCDCIRVPSVEYGRMGVVVNSSDREFLNLRKDPSLQADVLGIYYNGVVFSIAGLSDDGWYHVFVSGVEGYFRREYVREVSWPQGDRIVTVHVQGQSGVNMRQGPGYDYPAVRTCRAGAFLTLLEAGKDWYLVSDEGVTGFVRSSFLFEGVLNPVFQDNEVTGAYAVVNNPKATQVLNLRAAPSKASESIRQFSNGTQLTLLQQGTEWCRVTDGEGNTGYCMTEFLKLVNGQESPSKTVSHPEKTYVNLRSGPSTRGTIILCEVPHGSLVTVVVPDTDGWTVVRYGGQTGYMASMFLQ